MPTQFLSLLIRDPKRRCVVHGLEQENIDAVIVMLTNQVLWPLAGRSPRLTPWDGSLFQKGDDTGSYEVVD